MYNHNNNNNNNNYSSVLGPAFRVQKEPLKKFLYTDHVSKK